MAEDKAAALRAALQKDAPEMLAWMDEMKKTFGITVLHVKTKTFEAGKPQPPGVQVSAPAQDHLWPYAVGESPQKGKKK